MENRTPVKLIVRVFLTVLVFCSCNKNPAWLPLGPDNAQHYNNYVPIGGRVDDIGIAYNFDGKGGSAMFLACPGGGIWRSTDFTSASPTWQPLTDHLAGIPDNLREYINEISSVSVDYSNPLNIWASNSYAFVGLLHSTDGGNTWSLIGTSQFPGNYYIYKVLIDPFGDIWVGCDHGFYVSEDKGISFLRIDTPTFNSAAFKDMVWYSPRPQIFSVYVGVIDAANTNNKTGIWTVSGALGKFTWAQSPMVLKNIYGLPINSTLVSVIKLYADSKAGLVASASQAADFNCQDPTGSIWGLLNVFQYDGTSWQPEWQLKPGQVGNEVQGGYVQPVCITPDKRIYGGGKGIGVSNGTGGVLPIGGAQGVLNGCNITGDHTIADKNGLVYHVDVHKLVYSYADNKVYMATDGGMVRFQLDVTKAGGVDAWESINTSTLKNFLSETVAFSPSSPENVLAGHQDNGVLHNAVTEWDGVIVGESDYVYYDPFGIGYYMDCSGGCGSLGISADGGKSFASYATLPYDEHNPLLSIHQSTPNRMMIPCAIKKSLPVVYTVCETNDQWKTFHNLNLPNTGDHFYTTDPAGELARSLGYSYQGTACYVDPASNGNNTPFYRWVNPKTGDHFYTTDPTGELAPGLGYTSEGTACYVYKIPAPNTTGLYRWYNTNNGDHFYTTDATGGSAPVNGYSSEGIVCYVYTGFQSGTLALSQWYNHISAYPTAMAYSGNTIYICADQKIYLSQNDGTSWSVAWTSPANIVSIGTDINNPLGVYVVAGSAKIFYNADIIGNPQNFQDISGNLIYNNLKKMGLFSRGVGKDPLLYVATSRGVFSTSKIEGSTTYWSKFGEGLPDTEIRDLQVSQKTHFVYAATYGRGVWYSLDLRP